MSKVIEKKLGREKAYGMVFPPSSKIYIDPRQTPKSYLGTLIHEKLHVMFPDWSETRVRKAEKELANLLWKSGYRKVLQ
jgi:hypothetical protein